MIWFLFFVFVESKFISRFTNHTTCSEEMGSLGEGWASDRPVEGVWLGSTQILEALARPKTDFGAHVSGLWWKGKVNITKSLTCAEKNVCVVSAVWSPGVGWSSLGVSATPLPNHPQNPQFSAHKETNIGLFAQLEFLGPASADLWFNEVVRRKVERTACHIGKPTPGQLTSIHSKTHFIEGTVGFYHHIN